MTSHRLMLDIQLPRALGGWFTLSLPQSWDWVLGAELNSRSLCTASRHPRLERAQVRVWPQIIAWLKIPGLNWVKNEQSGHA